MGLDTLFPHQPAMTAPLPKKWQGRSKKVLRPTISFDGVVFVARHEGRPNRTFGATEREALNNLQAGAA